MRLSSPTLLLALALGSHGAPALASYNLVSNGSFDDGLTSWTQSGNWTQYDFLTPSKALALGNYPTDGVAGVEQALPTQNGKWYNVSLLWQTSGSNQYSSPMQTLQVLWNGSVLGRIDNSPAAHGTLSFSALATGNDKLTVQGFSFYGFNYVDNISVTSAVPEPESYAMLMLGLGLSTALLRRKRQQAR
jgi:hypothetical protein